ncbi:hypothetical protein [Shimia aestuarii]|uniref:hypothetical protein n=1 Tax=Shimia aestuarii TaxID=254406 RepID=UPI001FB21DEB|nr:hypothetical protein [Shimia aestuarii]
MDGIESISAERKRQIEQEGWTHEHDDQHTDETLALVAALYAAPFPLLTEEVEQHDDGRSYFAFMDPWPASWDSSWDRRSDHSRRRQLVIAGALIAAEIDRLDREGARNA